MASESPIAVPSVVSSAAAMGFERSRAGGWFLAAMVVVIAHAMAAYVGFLKQPVEILDEEPQGVISIELSPLVADASAPEAELARAEETTQTATPTSMQESHPDAAPEDVPIAAPSPAPNPTVVVPLQLPASPKDLKSDAKSVEPSKDKQQKDAEAKAVAGAQAAAAPHAAANPTTSDAAASPSAAPSKQGRSRKPSAAQVSWQKSLLLQLDRNKRYPSAARQLQLGGVVTVSFVIDRQGRVLSSRIAKSSGAEALDKEALDVLMRSSPLPPPPGDVGGETLSLSMPIQFRFQN